MSGTTTFIKERKKRRAQVVKARRMAAPISRDQKIAEMQKSSTIGYIDPMPLTVNRRDTYIIEQLVASASIVSSGTAGVEVDGAYPFQLSALDGVSALAAVFDQYRILQVSVTFEARYNNAMSGTSPSPIGQLYTAIDFDDSSSDTAAQLRQKQSCQIMPCWSSQKRTLTPKAAEALYGGGVFTSYGSISRPWINTASTSVAHYGVKYAMTNVSTTNQIIFDVFIRYVVQFRQVQ